MRKIVIFLLTLIALCLGQYCPRGKKVSMKVGTKYIFNSVDVTYPNKYAYLPKFFTKPDTEWLADPTEEHVGSHEIYIVVEGCKTAMLLELIVYDHHSPIKCEQPVYFMRKDGEEQTTACCNYRSTHFTDHTTINGEEKDVLQIEETEISEAINEEKEVIQDGNIDSSSTSGPSDEKSEKNEAFQIEENETTTEKIPNNEEKEVLQVENIETSTEAISITDEAETRERMEEIEAHFEGIPNTEDPKIMKSLKMEDIETSKESIPVNKEKVLQNSRIEPSSEIISITVSSPFTSSSSTITSSILPSRGTLLTSTHSKAKNYIGSKDITILIALYNYFLNIIEGLEQLYSLLRDYGVDLYKKSLNTF